ncbi:MAG: ABC transporter ATP-binding protein [Hyphomonadaceae bacterium]|nr:ABC transporter ATP-binding protein [Hyphomonadaceae bacterium]
MQGLAVQLCQETPIPLEAAFGCAAGEMLALVGPSGSGKSTILRCIAGLHRPERGSVVVDGEAWLDRSRGIDVATHRRGVGIVVQSYALFPHMTAIGNIEAALGHLPQSQRRDKARELLALVHLSGLEDRRPAELSGGQQQRVAVARALAREPKVLLLDEPFSAVDKVTRGRLYQQLAGMRQRLAMPIVLVTHDLDEALMLADSMCLLQRGRILQHGKPLELLQRPATVEAARLVGQRNIFPGRVLEQRAELTILDWRGRQLEVAPQPQWAPGTDIAWLIPPSKVVLHRRDRPSRGEAENPVMGSIVAHVALGDTTISTVKLDGNETRTLTLQVRTYVAERNKLGIGEQVALSLLAQAIHIMPAAAPRKR